MNMRMLKTELYKIYSRKVIWAAVAVFLAFYLIMKLQFFNAAGVKYTLEPVRPELTAAVGNDELHCLVRDSDYNCTAEAMKPFIPDTVFEYIEKYSDNERIYHSLYSDLVNKINNYYERTDDRVSFIGELAGDISEADGSALQKAKAKLLQIYRENPVTIELNLETSANNFIDVNHSAVFPGLIMLVIITGLSGIYSDEYTSGTLGPLLTSCKGRSGVFFSKLLAAVIYIFSVVAVMEAFYMTVTAICHHAPNNRVSAASTYGLSLTTYSGTVTGFCFRQIMGTFLSGLTLGSIVMCISVCSKNALIPFFSACIFYGDTAVWANMIAFPRFLSSVLSLPGQLSLFMLQTQVELIDTGHFINFFGILIPALTANIIFNLILMTVFLVLCYKAYTRKQVIN